MISVPGDSRESPGTKIIFYVILRRKSQEKRRNKRGAPKHMKTKARERKRQEETEKEKAKKNPTSQTNG
jgi:hypothetical protein